MLKKIINKKFLHIINHIYNLKIDSKLIPSHLKGKRHLCVLQIQFHGISSFEYFGPPISIKGNFLQTSNVLVIV